MTTGLTTIARIPGSGAGALSALTAEVGREAPKRCEITLSAASLASQAGLIAGRPLKLASGGVAGNAPPLVGERGPEFVVPKQAPITVAQNFTVGDVATVSMVRNAIRASEMRARYFRDALGE